MAESWKMTGTILGACSCDWGCPCSFDARPTQGFCEGGYTFVVDEGHFGDTKLDGLVFLWLGSSPGPLHEGNVKTQVLVDERANADQRAAVERLIEGGGVGPPFDVFAAVTVQRHPTIYAPIDVKVDGINSSIRVGDVYEMALARIRNPVSGDEEEIYLDKPTGFTSKRSELGMNTVMRLNTSGISYDHSGKYGEVGRFEYAGGLGE